jgi:hypothetical protein
MRFAERLHSWECTVRSLVRHHDKADSFGNPAIVCTPFFKLQLNGMKSTRHRHLLVNRALLGPVVLGFRPVVFPLMGFCVFCSVTAKAALMWFVCTSSVLVPPPLSTFRVMRVLLRSETRHGLVLCIPRCSKLADSFLHGFHRVRSPSLSADMSSAPDSAMSINIYGLPLGTTSHHGIW